MKERDVKSKFFLIGIILFCFSLSVFGQEADEMIAQADELFAEMQDMATAQEALALYRKALGLTENQYEPYWKISRIQYYIGAHTGDKNQKKAIFAQAVYYADRAIEREPEKPDGYYWKGVNNGKYGETRGVLKSLSLVKPIKNDMNKVIELDRSYEEGGPDRVFGRVYFKLPGFAGGSNDKSREHFEKSKEYGPNDAFTRVYLAETLMGQKEIDKAREELEFVLSMEDDPLWVSGIDECKEMARELLKDKKFKN
jgi:tetratricopeptide (TPR) repeat protein